MRALIQAPVLLPDPVTTAEAGLRCDAWLRDHADGRVEVVAESDGPLPPDAYECDEPAAFRVIFRHVATRGAGAATRMRCSPCAEGAMAEWGPPSVQLIPL